jgi:hypothetical protein
MKKPLGTKSNVLQVARKVADHEGSIAGRSVLASAARGVGGLKTSAVKRVANYRNGVPLLPSRGGVLTLQKVRRLMEAENI